MRKHVEESVATGAAASMGMSSRRIDWPRDGVGDAEVLRRAGPRGGL